jgi:hypothetical protein
MSTFRQYVKSASVILLVVGFTIIMSGVISVYAFPGYGPDIPAQDFVLQASKTLIKFQPGMSGSLVIWVSLYCPDSVSSFVNQRWFGCDTTIIQEVNLQIVGGCPGGAYCILDRTQLLVPPIYGAASDFLIYSFSLSGSGVSTITVVGTDQFGHTHSTQFGVALCYC